jgi:hypothetical protein
MIGEDRQEIVKSRQHRTPYRAVGWVRVRGNSTACMLTPDGSEMPQESLHPHRRAEPACTPVASCTCVRRHSEPAQDSRPGIVRRVLSVLSLTLQCVHAFVVNGLVAHRLIADPVLNVVIVTSARREQRSKADAE